MKNALQDIVSNIYLLPHHRESHFNTTGRRGMASYNTYLPYEDKCQILDLSVLYFLYMNKLMLQKKAAFV